MYSNVKYEDTFLTGKKPQTNIRNLSVKRNWDGDFGCDPGVWRVGCREHWGHPGSAPWLSEQTWTPGTKQQHKQQAGLENLVFLLAHPSV